MTDQFTQITISQNNANKLAVSGQEVVVPTVYFNNKILVLDAVQSSISGIYNDTLTCLNAQSFAEVGRLAFVSSSFIDYTKGYISDLLILNIPVTEQQNYSFLQGLVPIQIHSNVIVYIGFNQDRGRIAFDLVEQFNYSLDLLR